MSVKKMRIFTVIGKDGSIEKHHVNEDHGIRNSNGIPKEYFNLGMFFMVPILGGIAAGQWLDGRLDSGSTYTILLLVLGSVAAFYNLFSLLKKR